MQYRTPAARSHEARSALESRHCVPSPAPCWQVERALKRATTNYHSNAGMVVCSSGLQAAFNVARTMDGSCRKPFSLADVGARRATPCGGYRNARFPFRVDRYGIVVQASYGFGRTLKTAPVDRWYFPPENETNRYSGRPFRISTWGRSKRAPRQALRLFSGSFANNG